VPAMAPVFSSSLEIKSLFCFSDFWASYEKNAKKSFSKKRKKLFGHLIEAVQHSADVIRFRFEPFDESALLRDLVFTLLWQI
jgi:hypothetical protein